jgi:hypothetical protein
MKRITALAAAGVLAGSLVLAASPAYARTTLLVCSPSTNGGTFSNGVCVLPAAAVGQSYEAFIMTNDHTVDTFKITSGSLPPGLSMPSWYGSAGTIVAGTPSQQATFTFTVKVVNPANQTDQMTYSIAVTRPTTLTITNNSVLVNGTVGTAYATNFFLSGGLAPYTWSLAAGQLPPGLALRTTVANDTNNQLAGTPTTAGTYLFTMKLTDSSGQQATKDFSLTIQ